MVSKIAAVKDAISGGKSTQWRPTERAQMKAVHKAYRDGVMRNEEALRLPRMPNVVDAAGTGTGDLAMLASSGTTAFTPPQLDALDQTLQRIEGRIQASQAQQQQQGTSARVPGPEGGTESSPGGNSSESNSGRGGGGGGDEGDDHGAGSETETGGQAGGDR
jgi:hypothetical protein